MYIAIPTHLRIHETLPLKYNCEFFCPYSKIFNNQWGLSRFYAFLVIENWSSSDPDPKLIITDPDPANNFGSDRVRIHNTGSFTAWLPVNPVPYAAILQPAIRQPQTNSVNDKC